MRVIFAAWLLVLLQGSAAVRVPAAASEGDPAALERGRDVYAANCAVCHGVTGDGRGMAAHMFRVQPRDFRPGLLKFCSTPSGSLPSDEDLVRTITEGVRWTGMVGRPDLGPGDRAAVVEHVKTLSPRFAVERAAPSIAVPPAPAVTAPRVARGAELYRDADCASCHGARGRGDGPSAVGQKDDWGG